MVKLLWNVLFKSGNKDVLLKNKNEWCQYLLICNKWKQLLGQKYIQHPWVTCPNHIDHQGQTTKDHTWVPHGELLAHDQNSVCCPEFQLKETNHHAGKIFRTQPRKFQNNKLSINRTNVQNRCTDTDFIP